jgi:hypothetical protein
MENSGYVFEISLSVLNHLGRNLYRNFITVLGEAISNAWDADAKNVWIYLDKDGSSFTIKDDGDGMTQEDFQWKFLKVGYSKRKKGEMLSPGKRPYIGAKGIGKLALLSCAERVSVISKTEKTDYTGGVIDNSDLNDAIEQDITPDKYPLENVDFGLFEQYRVGHTKGTIIRFDQTKEDIKNTISHLRKLIALYFRFSLVDSNFNIFVNDDLVTFNDIKDLSEATEFVWNINNFDDPYIKTLSKLKKGANLLNTALKINAFIATVEKPRNLKIAGTEEKVGVDLFVNGRLRERDILKHLPDFSTRHIASYLYGQIHFDELDSDGSDRFGTSREGIVPGDEKYKVLIETLKNEILSVISKKWDELRLEVDEDGDDENPGKTLKERRALSLYNLSSADYAHSSNHEVDVWIKELQPDAEFNIPSYVECFLSENLIRKYIEEGKISQVSVSNEIAQQKEKEGKSKAAANISFDVRENNSDLSYLGMYDLADLVDKSVNKTNTNLLVKDAIEYKPIRDAVGHTAQLTKTAQKRLSLVYENLKAKIKILLS